MPLLFITVANVSLFSFPNTWFHFIQGRFHRNFRYLANKMKVTEGFRLLLEEVISVLFTKYQQLIAMTIVMFCSTSTE